MHSKIQSIIFNKSVFNVLQASRWCTDNGFKSGTIFESESDIRIRQISSSYTKSLGYTRFGTKQIENGISLLIVLRDEATHEALAEYAKINFEKNLNPIDQLKM